MPINLSKGQKVSLTKDNPGLRNITVGLGWDINIYDTGGAFDLDTAAFMLDGSGKCPSEKEFVFYGNLMHPSASVQHMGDNRTGEGEGDDEQIHIDEILYSPLSRAADTARYVSEITGIPEPAFTMFVEEYPTENIAVGGTLLSERK